ncbi:MAG: carbohydrate ABC transporter permease [Chloroflexi bacterium]|nr:carbohydrate ABC transporter permease [Chloroflexota bacterium]MBV9546037.1 carbohydrate ABC transporter permease [Chloroflexota bacterium]
MRRTLNLGRTRVSTYLLGAICVALCAFAVTPIIFAVLASFKSSEAAAATPPTYFPDGLNFASYQRLWNFQLGLPTYILNSLGTAALAIGISLAITIPAGYALARFPVPRKEVLFVFLLLGLIIPYQALLTPVFLMFSQLQLTNTLLGLAIIHTHIQLPFSLYVMRNSFEAVPRELDEAAVIDGASSWQVLVRVFLPSVRPAIITVALFAFITSWNEFLGALVMMNRGSSFTLPLVLWTNRATTSLGGTDWGVLQAGVTISIVPCVLFYLLLQRYYVSGLTSGAVK